jgi:hypothetical protein
MVDSTLGLGKGSVLQSSGGRGALHRLREIDRLAQGHTVPEKKAEEESSVIEVEGTNWHRLTSFYLGLPADLTAAEH